MSPNAFTRCGVTSEGPSPAQEGVSLSCPLRPSGKAQRELVYRDQTWCPMQLRERGSHLSHVCWW